MTLKALNQCYSLLGKDYRLLKVTFFLLASYLIIDIFYTFCVLKPTYSSNGRRKVDIADFPQITMCPRPPIDINALKSHGYTAQDAYFKGYMLHKMTELTWAGNRSEDVRKVSKDISSLKSIEDCGSGYFWFKNGTSQAQDFMNFTLVKALNPYHVCCRVTPPKLSQSHPIIALHFQFNRTSSVNSFKVFMADQLTASFFDQYKSNMFGDEIKSSGSGQMNYKVKIKEDIRLENEPNFPCIDYKIIGEYAKCVENEMVSQTLQTFLNCTPPWMTHNEDLWCNQTHALKTSDVFGKLVTKADFFLYNNFLSDISASDADVGRCLPPCRVKTYQARKIGLRQSDNRGFIIRFDKDVDITMASWTIDPKSLLSKIGGVIGICKNFVWLIILFLSSFSFVVSRFGLIKQ